MAKRARKQTAAERAAIDADREAAANHEGAYAILDAALPQLVPDPVIEPSPLVATYEKELAEEVDENGNTAKTDEIEEDHEIEGQPVELEDEAEEKVPVSIVKDKFKKKYIENAVAVGASHKAAKRSNWDWLSQQLATFCLNDGGKIDIGAFTDVLNANGVDHSRWTNKNRGWEGRFRMTGRVALQKVVANAGVLKFPGEGEPVEAPADWAERYKTKA